MIRVVILDFDDTLCLTEEACFYLENKVAGDMGFPPMSRVAHQANWGMVLYDAIQIRIPGIDPDEFVKREEELFKTYMADGKLEKIPDENLKTLDELKEKGKKLAIVTNRSLLEAKHLLHESHPLSTRIEIFYHRDILDFPKPDPRVFDQALKHFGVTPSECVYVGDAVNDAIAAKGAGLHFIALLQSGLRTREDFKDQNVDLFADKFPDILEYILEN